MIYYHCYGCKRDMDVSETYEQRGTRYCGSCDKHAEARDTEELTRQVAILREYFGVVEYQFAQIAPYLTRIAPKVQEIAATARNAMDLRVSGKSLDPAARVSDNADSGPGLTKE